MDTITFSIDKQQAIIGHALVDPKFYDSCLLWDVNRDRFNKDPILGMVWKLLGSFVSRHHRHPTIKESLTLGLEENPGEDFQARFTKTIKTAIVASTEIGRDVLETEMREWAANGKFVEEFNPGGAFRKAQEQGDTVKATQEVIRIGQELSSILAGGKAVRTTEATNREPELATLMAERAQGRIPFGISYLDDALHGIGQDELAIVSAATGAGKTGLMCLLAKNACSMGLKVSFLALEAHSHEIEQRLKYQILSELYFSDLNRVKTHDNGQRVHIAYDDWSDGMLQGVLDPYETEATKVFHERFANLRITYKDSYSPYDIAALTADVTREAETADLILLDHLHYVDTPDDENEVRAVRDIVQRLRQLANTLHKPIIAAAHIKKETFHRNLLLPSFNDIHGSSEITKSATFVIMLGPAKPFARSEDADSFSPAYTFVRILKNRKNGRKSWPTAVMVFDTRKDAYRTPYAFGQLVKGDTQWEPLTPDYWAKHATFSLPATEQQKVKVTPKAKDAA